jgi:hypothetical protein
MAVGRIKEVMEPCIRCHLSRAIIKVDYKRFDTPWHDFPWPGCGMVECGFVHLNACQ